MGRCRREGFNDGDEKIKILVVDDCPETLTALSETLDDPGYEVITALSGEQALKEVLRAEFAVILLDVQMPGCRYGVHWAA